MNYLSLTFQKKNTRNLKRTVVQSLAKKIDKRVKNNINKVVCIWKKGMCKLKHATGMVAEP